MRAPGFGGRVNRSVGMMQQYSAGVSILPRYPWFLPTKVVGTEFSFALSSFLRLWSVSYVGSPRIAVRTGCLK